jgi:D-alanyl-D-alanine dipeptidase
MLPLAIGKRVLAAALLVLVSRPVNAEPLPAGFVWLRELAAGDRAGHPLCDAVQFHRGGRARLWPGRMRADARRGGGTDPRRAAARPAGLWPEAVRLLPPGPGPSPPSTTGASGRARPISAASSIPASPGAISSPRATSPAIRAIRAAPPSISASSVPARPPCRRPRMPVPATVLPPSARTKAASISARARLLLGESALAIPASRPRPAATVKPSPLRLAAEGFRGYGKEWWHFTLAKEPFSEDALRFSDRMSTPVAPAQGATTSAQ